MLANLLLSSNNALVTQLLWAGFLQTLLAFVLLSASDVNAKIIVAELPLTFAILVNMAQSQ